MKPSKFIKGLTLFSFISCITAFLLYRIGKFDDFLTSGKSALQTSHNGGAITLSKNDSLKLKKDPAKKLMLSSSKSLILIDKKLPSYDSLKGKKSQAEGFKLKNKEMMSSSKSAIIFKPKEALKPKIDRSKTDTSKIKR